MKFYESRETCIAVVYKYDEELTIIVVILYLSIKRLIALIQYQLSASIDSER